MNDYYDKYKVNIPENQIGIWKVKKFVVSKEDEDFGRMRSVFSSSSRGRYVIAGTYTGLYRGSEVIMSDTHDEIRDHMDAINKATGKCLVNGLGLGMVASAMLNKPEVTHVTVIELSPEVIQLVGIPLKEKYGDRVTVIQADAYEYKPAKGEKFDVIWNDIWDNICSDNLKGMAKLHHKYGRKTKWQGSWSKEICQYYRNQDKRRGW